MRRPWLPALFLVFCTAAVGTAGAETRVAVVIGNSTYEAAEPLPNPANDARAVADVLERLGFTVDLHLDVDQLEMRDAFRQFGLEAESADVALVYYAGHGIQVAGENYLLPVDAVLRRERDLLYEALPLGIIMGEVAQAGRLGLVVLDACRDNPLADRLRQAMGPVRSSLVGTGLARVDALPSDTMIAFSTRPGDLAADGQGEHSPYTRALLRHIEEPGVELDLLFRRVRDTVLSLTAGQQEPRAFEALGAEPFYFVQPEPNRPPVIAGMEALEIATDAGPTPLRMPVPSDPDGDALTVQVLGLPMGGTIIIAGRPVAVGDELTPTELADATFRPDGTYTGNAGSFAVLIADERGGTMVGHLPVTIEAANQPPQVAERRVLRLPAIPLGIEAPVEPDGDPITITVTEVPEGGAVKHGDEVMEVGHSITARQLEALALEPGMHGATGAFSFMVTDSHGASVTSSVHIDIPAVASGERDTARTDRAEEPDEATAPPGEETSVAALPEPGGEAEQAPRPTADLARSGAADPEPRAERQPERDAAAAPAPIDEPRAESAREIKLAQFTLARRAPSLSDPAAATAGSVFQDCPECPVMVVVPGGTFTMGSRRDEAQRFVEEGPAHEVRVARFALGRTEVSVAEFAAFVEATGHRARACSVSDGSWRQDEEASWLDPGFPQKGDHPVVCVSWRDAAAYVDWLSRHTGQPYRLPSEAEWEYGARAGTTTSRYWGDDPEQACGFANVADRATRTRFPDWTTVECEDGHVNTAPSGSLEANAFGLHDMIGNAWEWVADCWHTSYWDAPDDGTARVEDGCARRTVRGGSWYNGPWLVRAAARKGYPPDTRFFIAGFRVARDLDGN